MVIPNRHVATLGLCNEEEACCLLRLVSEAASVRGAAITVNSSFFGNEIYGLALALAYKIRVCAFKINFGHMHILSHTAKST